MKYLKKFDNHSQYQGHIQDGMPLPNLSLCSDSLVLHYNDLPKGYQKLQYIQCPSVNAYLKTGIRLTQDSHIRVKFYNVAHNYGQWIIDDGGKARIYLGNANTTTLRLLFGSTSASAASYTAKNIHTVEMSKDGIFLDGTLVSSVDTTDFTSPREIMLNSSYNSSGAPNKNGYQTVRWYEIVADDTILIPCRRISDGKIGMWNTALREFRTSFGTEDFTGA